MKWLYYKLFGNISCQPRQRYRFTSAGEKNLARIERQIADFMDRHQDKVDGFYVTRYTQEGVEGPALRDCATIPEHHYGEFLRLRFRVDDADYDWAIETFLGEVVKPLEQGAEACLVGWRFYEGYEARNDLGARFGDLAHEVDPTEELVSILTAFTKLRILLLDHPDFVPNHDIVHLYFNQLGLLFPEEMAETERLLFDGEAAKYIMPLLHPAETEALHRCAATWRSILSRAIEERSNWLGCPEGVAKGEAEGVSGNRGSA